MGSQPAAEPAWQERDQSESLDGPSMSQHGTEEVGSRPPPFV